MAIRPLVIVLVAGGLLTMPGFGLQRGDAQAPGQGGRQEGGGQQIVLGPEDKPIAPLAPEGFNTPRAGVPQGRVETVEYPSTTVGTTRKAIVYLPPGFSTTQRYP